MWSKDHPLHSPLFLPNLRRRTEFIRDRLHEHPFLRASFDTAYSIDPFLPEGEVEIGIEGYFSLSISEPS